MSVVVVVVRVDVVVVVVVVVRVDVVVVVVVVVVLVDVVGVCVTYRVSERMISQQQYVKKMEFKTKFLNFKFEFFDCADHPYTDEEEKTRSN